MARIMIPLNPISAGSVSVKVELESDDQLIVNVNQEEQIIHDDIT